MSISYIYGRFNCQKSVCDKKQREANIGWAVIVRFCLEDDKMWKTNFKLLINCLRK